MRINLPWTEKLNSFPDRAYMHLASSATVIMFAQRESRSYQLSVISRRRGEKKERTSRLHYEAYGCLYTTTTTTTERMSYYYIKRFSDFSAAQSCFIWCGSFTCRTTPVTCCFFFFLRRPEPSNWSRIYYSQPHSIRRVYWPKKKTKYFYIFLTVGCVSLVQIEPKAV